MYRSIFPVPGPTAPAGDVPTAVKAAPWRKPQPQAAAAADAAPAETTAAETVPAETAPETLPETVPPEPVHPVEPIEPIDPIVPAFEPGNVLPPGDPMWPMIDSFRGFVNTIHWLPVGPPWTGETAGMLALTDYPANPDPPVESEVAEADAETAESEEEETGTPDVLCTHDEAAGGA